MLGSSLVVIGAAEALGLLGSVGGLVHARSRKSEIHKQRQLTREAQAGA
jgi:hypothetical protein